MGWCADHLVDVTARARPEDRCFLTVPIRTQPRDSMFGFFRKNKDIFHGSAEVERAFAELQVKTSAHVRLWHLDTAD